MQDVIAMVLAGGRVEELSVLTSKRPKAAVPFGGQYRFIDFALSNLMHSELERVGVISLYKPFSLIEHVGIGEPWDLIGRGRLVKILPPYMDECEQRWYRGTADAIYQNLNFISKFHTRDILILSGDHIYCMDFRPLIQQHRETQADLTMVVKPMPPDIGKGQFGFAEVDGRSRVVGYEEKPQQPRSNLVSLTIYVFRTETLIQRLEENQRIGNSFHLYSEVLPEMVKRDRVFAFPFYGYWNYARSVDSYHQASMDLIGENSPIQLSKWGIRTRPQFRGLGDLSPVNFSGKCSCIDSLVCPGVKLAGTVERCILSPGVCVERNSRVMDSILMNDTIVREGAVVDHAVLDKNVVVGRNAVIGDGKSSIANQEIPHALNSGISLVGKRVVVPEGARIGRNCVVDPDVTEQDWREPILREGSSLHRPSGGRS